MTATKTLLKLLGEGKPRSIAELAEMTGMTAYKVTYTIDYLRDIGQIAPTPRTYTVTPLGKERLAGKKMKPRPSRKRKNDERVLRSGERRRLAEQVVERAMHKRGALAEAWGASA